MRNRHEIAVSLKLGTPFLFPAVENAGFGSDAVQKQRGGKAIIPQDQFRGVLRDLWQSWYEDWGKAHGKPNPDQYFGTKSDSESVNVGPNQPNRGYFVFNDLEAASIGAYEINRVEIDKDTGSAKHGSLAFFELSAPVQEAEIEFSGTIIAFLEAGHEVDKIFNALATRISAIGAMKSAGFGETKQLRFTWKETPRAASSAPVAERYRCKMTINKPFLVDSLRENENVYISSTVIPGGAIKGALARTMQLSGKDVLKYDSLSQLRIGHARNSATALPLRLSIMATSEVAFDTLNNSEVPDSRALAVGDWKVKWNVAKRFGRESDYEPNYDTRAHVEIQNNIAKKGILFFNSAVDPHTDKWEFDLDFGQVPSKERAELMDALLAGSDWLGVTGAGFEISVVEQPWTLEKRDKRFAIMLTTPACLHSQYSEDIVESYRDYFTDNYGLKLIDFAAQQSLRGGFQGNWQGSTYSPYILTETGSVFLLEGSSDQIDYARRYGLKCAASNDWKHCPFQPENGYGEFSLESEELKPCH